ncbi:MAG: glucose 1-dehydrogenase [Rhizonema sp. NSF051]|nr:glucose 1-dehydrogenase [Rhizonema sp. NSF051]
MSNLVGKVALVTGASRGIGAAIAEALGNNGAKVVVNYVSNVDAAEKIVYAIRNTGSEAIAIQADVSDPEQVKKLFAAAIKEYGQLDILVNNAGTAEFAPLDEIDEGHIDRQFNLNVRGLLFATQEAARVFGKRGGRIINISSVVSQTPLPNAAVYSATKGAVDVITQSLAHELAPRGILVNAISPGFTATDMGNGVGTSQAEYMRSRTPLGRVGQPVDIARAVAFLASDDAAWITSEVIAVSGGIRL